MVDARAGPGTKSLTKFKSKKIKKNINNPDKPLKEKIKKKHRSVVFCALNWNINIYVIYGELSCS